MKIAIANDHAAVEAKQMLQEYLSSQGHELVNCGTDTGDSVDYPDFAAKACTMVQAGEAELALLVCGTGIGISIAANKHKGIRAALLNDPFSARMAREHNHANAICFGARVMGPELMKACCDAFFAAEAQAGNHERRVGKINAIEG